MRGFSKLFVVVSAVGAVALSGCGGGGGDDGPSSDGSLLPDARRTADAAFDSAGPGPDGSPDADLPDADLVNDAMPVPDAGPDAPPGTACTAPLALTSGVARTGTVTGTSNFAPNSASCSTGAGGEVAYSFTLATASDLIFTVAPTGFDAVAYVHGATCTSAATDVACVDGGGVGASETITLTAAAPGTYHFFVDGVSAGDAGSFSATLTVRAINGDGGACNGTTSRCDDAFVCAAGTCRTPAVACGVNAEGTLTVGATSNGNTTGATSDLSCVGSGSAPDEHWRLTADATGGTYVVQVASADHSILAYQITDCDSDLAEACTGGAVTSVDFDVVLGASASTFVAVDGIGSAAGAYTIRADKVNFLTSGATCNASAPLVDRCPSGTSCNGGVCAVACGNGILDAGEECDDGGTSSTDGCSNLCKHEITYTAVNETSAPNDDPTSPQTVTPDALVAGEISVAADRDNYAVSLAAGEILIAEVRSRGPNSCADGSLNSQIRLYGPTSGGSVLLTTNDDKDGSASTCSYVFFQAPTNAIYGVEVRAGSAASSSTFQYELRLYTQTPTFGAATETEDNGTLATFNTVALHSAVTSAISARGDIDFVGVTTIAGMRLFVETAPTAGSSVTCTSGLDTAVEIYGPPHPAGSLLGSNDDVIGAGGNRCSSINLGTRRNGVQKVRTTTGAAYIAPTPFVSIPYLVRITAIPE